MVPYLRPETSTLHATMQPGCWDFELLHMQSAAASQGMLVRDPAAKLDLTAWPTAAAPCMRAATAQVALHGRPGILSNASQPLFTTASAAAGPAVAPAAAAAHTRGSDSSSDDDLDTAFMRMLSSLAQVRSTRSEPTMHRAGVPQVWPHCSQATAHLLAAVCRTPKPPGSQTARRRRAHPAGGGRVPRRQRVRRSIRRLPHAFTATSWSAWPCTTLSWQTCSILLVCAQ
jgi:hypothetical protein